MNSKTQLIRVTKNFQISLPAKLRKNLCISEGDYLEANVKNGIFYFKPKKLVDPDPNQSWFWENEWQKKEKEAQKDIKQNNLSGPFDNTQDLIKELEK